MDVHAFGCVSGCNGGHWVEVVGGFGCDGGEDSGI